PGRRSARRTVRTQSRECPRRSSRGTSTRSTRGWPSSGRGSARRPRGSFARITSTSRPRFKGGGRRWSSSRRLPREEAQQAGEEDPTLARANAFPAQSRPGLSVSLAVERRFGQNVADLPKEAGVGVGRSGAPLLGRGEGQFELRPDPVQRRSSHLELLGHSGHAIASVGGRRDGAAPSLDFRQGKGDSASSARALSLASSSLIVRSPTSALSLSTSSSAAVLSRDFRPAWPAARNSSRHRESVAAVTPSSRESSSRASPRRRRRTASALRLEENRPRSFPDRKSTRLNSSHVK